MYERIKNMSPEEMAVFLCFIKARLYDPKEPHAFSVGEPAVKRKLEWLMSEDKRKN